MQTQRAGTPRVLIVEDEPALAELITDVLDRQLGCRVTVVGSIKEARRALAVQPIELMLTDIYLPDGDGMALVKALRRHQPLATSIVMTGAPSLSGAVEALRFGAFDFLSKPFNMDALVNGARKALRAQSAIARNDSRFERLREAVKRLNDSRRQVTQKVDLLCNDLVAAYGDVARQLDLVRIGESFRESCKSAVDLEQLLCHAMDWLLRQIGFSNLGIWLADDADFQLGAYMKYDIPGDQELTEAMKCGLVPLANRTGILHLEGDAMNQALTGAEKPFLIDQTVLATGCTYLGETIATLVLFRHQRTPFTEQHKSIIRAIGPIFSLALSTIVRGPGTFDGHDSGAASEGGDTLDPDDRRRRDEADWWKNGQPPPF
jgi:FixJ family two-component response regulator